MRYKRLCINAPDEHSWRVFDILLESGVTGYEVIDDKPVDNPFDFDYEELKPDIMDMGGVTSVIFYLEEDEDESRIFDRILEEIPGAKVSLSVSDESDWRDKWKDYFHAFTIGDILIKPSWEDVRDQDAPMVIEIDPGISFGTGAHETTRMCIEALSRAGLKGRRVMDCGCGSGILSIAAHRLGAEHITCVDIDPDCIETSRDNINKNGCDPGDFSFYCGDIVTDKRIQSDIPEASVQVIVANILADIVINMLPAMKTKLTEDGLFILSGIIEGKENMVVSAMEKNNIQVTNISRDGEWFMIEGKKQGYGKG